MGDLSWSSPLSSPFSSPLSLPVSPALPLRPVEETCSCGLDLTHLPPLLPPIFRDCPQRRRKPVAYWEGQNQLHDCAVEVFLGKCLSGSWCPLQGWCCKFFWSLPGAIDFAKEVSSSRQRRWEWIASQVPRAGNQSSRFLSTDSGAQVTQEW